jgi:two-component system LytT family response regulator
LKAIIIDDEQSSIDILKMLIEKSVPEIIQIYTANGALEALNIVENQQFDIVFLDIEMPEINGFDFLKIVKNRNFETIFTTAHNQYAIKAIKFSALDYLLKPIEISELKEAVSRVLANRNTQKNYEAIHENLLKNLNNNKINEYRLAINTYDGVRFFDINNIEYLKADSNYTHL